MNTKTTLSLFSAAAFVVALYFFLQIDIQRSSKDLKAAQVMYYSAKEDILKEFEATPDQEALILAELEATPENQVFSDERMNEIDVLYQDHPCLGLFFSCVCVPETEQPHCSALIETSL